MTISSVSSLYPSNINISAKKEIRQLQKRSARLDTVIQDCSTAIKDLKSNSLMSALYTNPINNGNDNATITTAINALVPQYNTALSDLYSIIAELPSSSTMARGIQNLAYDNLTIKDQDDDDATMTLSDFGIIINSDGTLTTDSTKLTATISADCIKAANFFNAFSLQAQLSYRNLAITVADKMSDMKVEQEKIDSKIDTIIDKAETQQLKFEEAQQRLKQMMEDFNLKMQQMQDLFAAF